MADGLSLTDPLVRAVGRRSATAMSHLELNTVGDLLRHYPRAYLPRGGLTDMARLEVDDYATVSARITKCEMRPMRSRGGTLVNVTITDGRTSMVVTFFHISVYKQLIGRVGQRALFAGKVTLFNKKTQLAHPKFHIVDGEQGSQLLEAYQRSLIPVYPASEKTSSWDIHNCVLQVLNLWEGTEDPVPGQLRAAHGLIDLTEALRSVHRPGSESEVERAHKRFKWDEALAVQLALAQRRRSTAARRAGPCPPRSGGLLTAFDKRLPFTLTEGQVAVGEDLARDLAGAHPMNRLVQGEVGSGKTIVALRAMLQVVDSGRQAAMLAPTEVLATQHERSLRELLGPLGAAGELGAAEEATGITLLTGSMTVGRRRRALLEVASGTAGIVVGTHALIQDGVAFADLGLVVVDEQHRFGVEQRDALRTRAAGDLSPHVLVMTATPIPRTVAMTVYGDLEVSALRQLPEGRSPISTHLVPLAEQPGWIDRVWSRVEEEVGGGHQAYVVCPRIGDGEDGRRGGHSEEVDGTGPDEGGRRPPLAVVEYADRLSKRLPTRRVGMLHGRMDAEDKDRVMTAFAAGRIDVLVATTVIEVGVNVPNATAMVILDADRFGISQLHQLRGRVGRGTAPGLCLLVTEAREATQTRARLEAVASTTDGFELARLDLELRQEGDILGQAQSGRRGRLRMLSLSRDEDVIAESRLVAGRVVDADPELVDHPGLAGMVAEVIGRNRADFLDKT